MPKDETAAAGAEAAPRLGPFLLAFAPMLVGAALHSYASWALSAVVGVRLAASTAPVALVGIVLSCHFLGFVIGCLLCSRLIARLGHVRAFAVYAAGATCLVLVIALTEAIVVWGVLRICVGICLAGLYTVIESWLNQQVASAIRGRAFAVYVVTSSGASALGPLTLNLVDPYRWEMFAISAIAFALAPIAMTVTTPRVPVVGASTRLRLRALIALAPGGVIACFGHGLVLSAVSQVSAVYFQQRGFDHARLSVFLSAVTIAGVAMQLPIGWVSDRLGRFHVLLVQALLAAAAALVLALSAEPSFTLVLVLGLAVVAMAKPFYSLGVTIANDRLGGRDFVDAAGALLLIWASGSVVGPIAATTLIGWLGPGGLFWHIAGASLCMAAVVVHRLATMPSPTRGATA